ncbi:MAG: hypothetical protein R3Y64_11095 [Peptostreptococcaceae bacterium]
MIVERDLKIVEFIDLVELATNKHIQELFFENVNNVVCSRRLAKLANVEYIKRCKLDSNKYYYYGNDSKKPNIRLVRHDLLLTDYLVELIKLGANIIDFKRNLVIDNVICDGFIKFKLDDKIYTQVLEVQLSNKISDCIDKYSDFKTKIYNAKLNDRFEIIPTIICLTDLKDKVNLKGYRVRYLDTNLQNLKEVLI